MHELSIAESLIDVAREHLPPGGRPSSLTVEAGPMRAIEPDAMEWAWQAARADTEFADAELDLIELPWQLQCLDCDATWSADRIDAACVCGSTAARPVGGDELRLMSMDIVEPETAEC